MKNSDITDLLFRNAVEAIDKGDISLLQQLLKSDPGLVTRRLDMPEKGYFQDPYLLWFVADNPVRHQKLPSNIVEVTEAIIKVLQNSPHHSYQHQLDYTLGLVCTGRIAKECGVQIPLMELLIKEGAKVKGSVLGPIGQHNFEAAKYLLEKGSNYNLAAATGLYRLGDVKKFVKNASASERYVALVVASFFGRADIVSLLIETGTDLNGNGKQEDFGGFHSHASPLHQAVYSGSLETVKLLVEAGANLNATDKAYSGTPLGWAMYIQAEENDEVLKGKYKEIEYYLSAK